MEHKVIDHPHFGESLYVTNGVVELIIPLSYGIRIGHFSLCGEKNVFFEQPADMTDLTTPKGWRIRGGHRLWLSPESDDVYCPDNEPISCTVEGDSILLAQPEDPWLHIVKSMEITFGEDASVQVVHRVQNTGMEPRTCALWPISVMAPGGTQHIPLMLCENGDLPSHWISLWDFTDLGDKRAAYSRKEIVLTHSPESQPYKIGISRLSGPVQYENNGVIFEMTFPVIPDVPYPDNHVSYETFMCEHMVELESLSPMMTVPALESREHREVWRLRKTD